MRRARKKTVPKAVPAESAKLGPRAYASALAIGAFFLYLGALSNGFVFDDEGYVVSNPNVQGGLTWRAIRWAFSSVHRSNFHPLTWLSHTLDWTLWGANPLGHHLTGVLLHAANTALLFLVLRRMTGLAGRSACVAALFAVHPLHVESVAWVSERKDTLSTLFWLLAMHAYVRYVELRRLGPYVLAVVFLALGVLSKQMVVTLPAVLLLLDFWPLRRRPAVPRTPLLAEKLPFALIALAGSVVAVLAQGKGGSLVALDVIPIGQRVANAALSYVRYLLMALWPIDLAVFYPFRPVPPWQAAASAIVIVTITVLALRVARRHPAVTVGWMWYLVTLLPVIGVVQIGDQALADRYTYIPLVGIFVAVCWLVPEAIERRPQLKPILVPATAAVLLALSALTLRQIATWHDEVTLYEHALSATTDNYLAHGNLGAVLVAKGRLTEAVPHFREAVRIRPDRAVAYSNLGNALADSGKVDEAIEAHRRAVGLEGTNALHWLNLGSALAAAGHLEEAGTAMAEAVKVDPDNVLARTRLARVRALQGRKAEAEEQLTLALRLAPASTSTLLEMGSLRASQGRRDDAVALFRNVASADPSNAIARANLGILLVEKGDLAQGIAELSRAVELAPGLDIARQNLVRALVTSADARAASGQYAEAVRQLDMALAASGNAAPVRAALEPRRAAYLNARPLTK